MPKSKNDKEKTDFSIDIDSDKQPKIEPPKEKAIPTPALTNDEIAIKQRVEADFIDWKTITEESLEDFSLSENIYKLPKEAMEKQNNKEFAFRFIEMKQPRIDQVRSWPRPLRWTICNRVTAPFLEAYINPNHGGIQIEDQILVMKLWHDHKLVQDKKHELADNQDSRIMERLNGKTDLDGKVEYMTGEGKQIGERDEILREMDHVHGEGYDAEALDAEALET